MRSPSSPVRRTALAAGLAAAGFLGCGDGVSSARPVEADRTAHVPVVVRPDGGRPPPAERLPTTDATVDGAGALERHAALARFYAALAALEDGGASSDVRVTWLGDSHTAADVLSGTVRRQLQARFGDGGRGFVALGKPYPFFAQDGLRGTMTGFGTATPMARRTAKEVDAPSRRRAPARRKTARSVAPSAPPGDGLYGLGALALLGTTSTARARTELTGAAPQRAEVWFLRQPRGGSFDVVVDDGPPLRVTTRDETIASGFAQVTFSGAGPHALEVRAVGDGEARVFGAVVDRDERGVVLDALGINGARVTTALGVDEAHFREQLQRRAPQLVVLAYGTNESGDDAKPELHEQRMGELLGRVARAAPGAACLVLGPPDRALRGEGGAWETSTALLEVAGALRRAAFAGGCAFYDQIAAMGGEGSMAAWALESPPRAQKDRVHLTRDGYLQVGGAMASDLLRGYGAWRKDRGLAEAPPRPRAPVAPPAAPTQAVPESPPSEEP